MSTNQLHNFCAKISRETRNMDNNPALEYELRFGYKNAGKFVPMFNDTIKAKIFAALDIDKDLLVTEESINSYYDGNIRKVAIKYSDGVTIDTFECKHVIKRVDWYMDNGICLRFAVSHEQRARLDNIDLTNPSVIRKKVREIYTIPDTDTEIHFTTVDMSGVKGDILSQEIEIEYKKIKDIDINMINKILNCFN